MITNQEYMLNLRPDDCYAVMQLVIQDSGRPGAVIKWLASEAIVGELKKVDGYRTLAGDSVYKCPKCGDMHVNERRVICPICWTFNLYPYTGGDDASENSVADA